MKSCQIFTLFLAILDLARSKLPVGFFLILPLVFLLLSLIFG